MAPPTQIARVSELETNVQKLDVQHAVLKESHERLINDVHILKDEVKELSQNMSEIRITIAQWSVGVAIIIGVGATIGGWFIKTSLDGLRSTMNSRIQ